MRTSKNMYSEAMTPEGSLVIEQLTHGELNHAIDDLSAAIDIQRIGQDAWANSSWLGEIAVEQGVEPDILASEVFDPQDRLKWKPQLDKVEQSSEVGRRAVYWLGEVLKPLPAEDDETASIWESMPTGYPDGFAKIIQDTGSEDSTKVHLLKRAVNLGIYASIHDLNVTTAKQGKGLGTALAYNGLADQPRRMKSSLYTAENNEAMRAWAEKYGYSVTDEYEDDTLFSDVAVPSLRYEAKSVGSVLSLMEEAQPWLKEGKRSGMLERVLDEADAEFRSRNPRGY